jgi:hypothetical protein
MFLQPTYLFTRKKEGFISRPFMLELVRFLIVFAWAL